MNEQDDRLLRTVLEKLDAVLAEVANVKALHFRTNERLSAVEATQATLLEETRAIKASQAVINSRIDHQWKVVMAMMREAEPVGVEYP